MCTKERPAPGKTTLLTITCNLANQVLEAIFPFGNYNIIPIFIYNVIFQNMDYVIIDNNLQPCQSA
jgi:hypothetical protein